MQTRRASARVLLCCAFGVRHFRVAGMPHDGMDTAHCRLSFMRCLFPPSIPLCSRSPDVVSLSCIAALSFAAARQLPIQAPVSHVARRTSQLAPANAVMSWPVGLGAGGWGAGVREPHPSFIHFACCCLTTRPELPLPANLLPNRRPKFSKYTPPRPHSPKAQSPKPDPPKAANGMNLDITCQTRKASCPSLYAPSPSP